MHIKNSVTKSIVIITSILLFVCFMTYEEKHYRFAYMEDSIEHIFGIPVITENMLSEIAYQLIESENIVYLNGIKLPYEEEKNRLFISWNIEQDTEATEIDALLKSGFPNYQLYFLQDKNFENLSRAMRKGHSFQMAAVETKGRYMLYEVIFTSLPVIEMNGTSNRIDYRDREIYEGEIKVWDPCGANEGKTTVITNRLEWKLRGNTAMEFPKKSYKISLKDKNRKSENVSLLGMEKDDDYILNPMWMDDLKVREKLVITLWNEIAFQKGSTICMSDAEYCELIINDSYQGICLLQKRIEKKFLKLDEEDILFKGSGLDKTEESTPEDMFEIIYTPLNEEETYTTMESFLYDEDFSMVDKESWIDNQLFMQLGHMIDNRRYKNMYYIVDRSGDQESISFLPWDTDMSFGISWNKGFSYNPDSVENVSYRIENDAIIEQYPELETMQAERWAELRGEIFSQNHLLEIISSNFEKLDSSGVLARDYQVLNKNAWGGKDTRENLEKYIARRLELLDEKYGYTVGGQ